FEIKYENKFTFVIEGGFCLCNSNISEITQTFPLLLIINRLGRYWLQNYFGNTLTLMSCPIWRLLLMIICSSGNNPFNTSNSLAFSSPSSTYFHFALSFSSVKTTGLPECITTASFGITIVLFLGIWIYPFACCPGNKLLPGNKPLEVITSFI